MKYWTAIAVGITFAMMLNFAAEAQSPVLTCQNTRTLDIQQFPGRFYCPQGWTPIYY